MQRVRLFGASYSVYTRSVRLLLEEKAVAHELVEVDVFAAAGPPAEHLARHPFGRVPVLDHGGFLLYETVAILRYLDETFARPPLMPSRRRERARVAQALGILDHYAYRTLVWDIFVERVERPRDGTASDEAKIAAALPRAETCLAALAALSDGEAYLVGESLSLADLHAAPMMAYFTMAPESRPLLAAQPRLAAWWAAMARRPSLARTRSPLEDDLAEP